jgi:hypothetical protein
MLRQVLHFELDNPMIIAEHDRLGSDIQAFCAPTIEVDKLG